MDSTRLSSNTSAMGPWWGVLKEKKECIPLKTRVVRRWAQKSRLMYKKVYSSPAPVEPSLMPLATRSLNYNLVVCSLHCLSTCNKVWLSLALSSKHRYLALLTTGFPLRQNAKYTHRALTDPPGFILAK